MGKLNKHKTTWQQVIYHSTFTSTVQHCNQEKSSKWRQWQICPHLGSWFTKLLRLFL